MMLLLRSDASANRGRHPGKKSAGACRRGGEAARRRRSSHLAQCPLGQQLQVIVPARLEVAKHVQGFVAPVRGHEAQGLDGATLNLAIALGGVTDKRGQDHLIAARLELLQGLHRGHLHAAVRVVQGCRRSCSRCPVPSPGDVPEGVEGDTTERRALPGVLHKRAQRGDGFDVPGRPEAPQDAQRCLRHLLIGVLEPGRGHSDAVSPAYILRQRDEFQGCRPHLCVLVACGYRRQVPEELSALAAGPADAPQGGQAGAAHGAI
mmetsp:Transcript_53325/g.114566  ORF Transcript_53325/g.114566 Transcript_53325/m.114566 type:complete len:263 (-) Transcript_53325:905-1693(-)